MLFINIGDTKLSFCGVEYLSLTPSRNKSRTFVLQTKEMTNFQNLNDWHGRFQLQDVDCYRQYQ